MLANYYVFGRKNQLPIILKIDTTLSSINPNSFLIRTTVGDVGNIDSYGYRVDWDDETYDTEITGNISHTYTTGGIYYIKIYGKFPRFSFKDNGDSIKVLEVVSWGNVDFSNNQDNAFMNCINLTKIASNGIWFNKITSAHAMFSGCKLTELPDDMLLSELIRGGTNNTGGGMFNGCKLTSLPSMMTLPKLVDGYRMFSGNRLTEVPIGMTLPKVKDSGYMFNGNLLTNISNISLPVCTTADSAFRANVGITNISETMTLPELINGGGMFNGCKLTHLPANMTLDKLSLGGTGNSNGSMFQYNRLTDLPLGMTLKSLTRGTDLFQGNTINTNRYSKLLQDLSDLNPNSNVVFHGGSSKYNSTAVQHRGNLVTNKGWTITDGGLI